MDKKTGEIVAKYSEHHWVSSIPITIKKVHALCNFGARKLCLLEDRMNTEKNRCYHYEHAFSYHWNSMQGFHLLMRLGHTINALSEFTKKMKKWIKEQGCSATLVAPQLCDYLLDSGAPLKVVQENADPSNVSTTMHYRHIR